MSPVLNLLTLFYSLAPPAAPTGDTEYFSARAVPGYENHRLGKDINGAPSLLISVRDFAERTRPSPTVLANLTIQHDVDCRIQRGELPPEEGQFTVLRCTSTDAGVHLHFLDVASPLLMLVGVTPSRVEVSRIVDGLVELFRAIDNAPKKTVQGLWAEIFLISGAASAKELVKAWHVVPQDRYDFNAGSQRMEVKSSTWRIRKHHFSHEQLYPPAGTQLLIVSVFVERAGGGASLGDLITQIRDRLDGNAELISHVDQTVYQTLGNSWQRALDERFDLALAQESLAFFDSGQIPKPPLELPLGVSEVHFRSDLTCKMPIEAPRMESHGGLFRAAARR